MSETIQALTARLAALPERERAAEIRRTLLATAGPERVAFLDACEERAAVFESQSAAHVKRLGELYHGPEADTACETMALLLRVLMLERQRRVVFEVSGASMDDAMQALERVGAIPQGLIQELEQQVKLEARN